MFALINPGNAPYYKSAVFGYFNGDRDNWKGYYIVLDSEKRHLIKQYKYDQKAMPGLIQTVLVTSRDHSDWALDKDKCGCVSFIQREKLAEYLNGDMPAELLQRSLAYDAQNPYKEQQPVESQADIENLMLLTGEFHDAFIEKIEKIPDGIRVTFDGIWGCKLEATFTGDVTYRAESREEGEYDLYWLEATTGIENGFIYLTDGYCEDFERLTGTNCWFKARHMTYHVIPNRECWAGAV